MENPFSQELRPEKRIVANKLEECESVLEVGCQWGECLIAIREKFPKARIVGVDADWGDIIKEAKEITGLDLREGNVFKLDFKDKEFDVVFTEALFCMLLPKQVEEGLREIIRVAKKYIILVELENKETGLVAGRRTGANWVELFKKYGLEATKEKIPRDVWNADPWIKSGYIYTVKL